MILISKIECLKILQNSYKKKFKLLSYRIDIISEKSLGFLGEYYILIADIKDVNKINKTLTFFIKSLPVENQIERNRIESYGMFTKEGALYNFFENFPKSIKENEKWRPDCYYTRPDIIVLEHLPNLGYFHVKEFEFTFNHIKAVLKNLAKLHAFSIAFEIENSIQIGDKYKDILFETSIAKDIEWFQVGLEAVKTVIMLHPKFQSNEHQLFIKNNFHEKIEPIYDMVKSSTEFRNVLCHRDPWGNNIYFKWLNNNVNNNNNNNDDDNNNNNLISVLVDFQTCCYCPPAIDVLFFIYLNTRRSFRENIFDKSLKCYHNELEKQLKLLNIKTPIITFDEFIKSCEKFKLLLIVYNCIAGTVVRLPNDYLKKLKESDFKEYDNYINKNRNNIIKKFLAEDSNFNEFMCEAVEELMELIYV